MESLKESANYDERRLQLPTSLRSDRNAFELVSVWCVNGKATTMTGTGTGLDKHPEIWGEILAGICENVARSLECGEGSNYERTVELIKSSFESSMLARGQR